MGFLKWLWKQWLTRPGRVAVAGLVVAMAGGVVEQIRVTRGAGSIVAACGSWMLVVAMLIWLLTVVGRALPRGTDIAARVMIDVMVALFLAFFQLLVAAIATSADPSVIAAVATNKGARGPGGTVTSALGLACLFAIPVVLVVIPERLRWNRPWSCASPLARTLVPSWLAASAASATWGYVFAEHFFAGPLAGPSLGVIAVGGLAVAALLVPVYQFMARSCWEYGIEVVLDPKRWGDTRRNLWLELGGAFGAKPSSETAQHSASGPVASGTGTAAAPAEGEEVGS